MEHIYENQQPDEPLAHDVYIQNLGHENADPRIVLERVKQFGRNFAYDEAASKEALGQLICGALDIPEEMMDDESIKDAKRMLLFGSMTALYVGNEMANGFISNKEVLNTTTELMKHSPNALLNDAAKFVQALNPNTRAVLEQWKTTLDGGGENGTFFDAGFGAMMCSVNKTIYELDMFSMLERENEWDTLDQNEASPIALQALDDDCLRLAVAFQEHKAAVGLDMLSGEELRAGLEKAAKMLETDLAATEDLRIDDHVQTRGLGICINFDEQGDAGEVCEFDDELRVRGRIIGMECMSAPTEFALMMGIHEGDDAFESQVCLILDDVELMDPGGEVTSQEGIAAIPLRASGTTQLDKIIYPMER